MAEFEIKITVVGPRGDATGRIDAIRRVAEMCRVEIVVLEESLRDIPTAFIEHIPGMIVHEASAHAPDFEKMRELFAETRRIDFPRLLPESKKRERKIPFYEKFLKRKKR